MSQTRCCWCSDDPLYQAYHDQEWGRAVKDSAQLFRLLCLEGQQAGLSWLTILKKRAAYDAHFFQYSIAEIAQISDEALALKACDASLIRHLAKLHAIRDNAQAWQRLQQQHDPVQWLWQFSQPNIQPCFPAPTQSQASVQMAKGLKKYGFKFVGARSCYAFMQASGMVNDHEPACFLYQLTTGHVSDEY